MPKSHPTMSKFTELDLPARVIDLLETAGITTPSAIQAQAIPDALAGRDILGRAQTGSGKTLAFALPMLARLHTLPGSRALTAPRGLVLVPTRELANQVAEAIDPLARSLDQRVVVVVGGLSIGKQIEQIRRGVDIVVATPGRLIDLMERRAVSLDSVAVAVLDEADHMADLGFLPAVTRILEATPRTRQCLLFSATLDRGVDKVAKRFLSNPATHAVDSETSNVDTMSHRVFRLRHDDKVEVAAELAARPARTLIFVRTKHGADRLARQLRLRGVEAGAIHGNLNQNQRTRTLDAFSSGRARVLVATDVAARGIHVDDVDLVVHFDPPNDHKDYLHRSGRTARAGATGTVISFVMPEQAKDVARLHTAAGVRPDSTTVSAGHPAVREVAASGLAIEVRPESIAMTSRPERGAGRPHHSRAPRGARPQSGGHGQGQGSQGSQGAQGSRGRSPRANGGARRRSA